MKVGTAPVVWVFLNLLGGGSHTFLALAPGVKKADLGNVSWQTTQYGRQPVGLARKSTSNIGLRYHLTRRFSMALEGW
ncbi:hypothetical protein NDU88_004613 [Pleurodeles waltl]|uniref:Secreted protein n=1 Tax=Pleurodeles waltl TaxID=8319 RepID=A0AAV7VKW6_PLEWA|nr:hypothetical protein NDU88_004613 [Pleurodeles waltl]